MTTLLCDVGGVLIENPWVATARALSERYKLGREEVFDLLTGLARELDTGKIRLRDYNKMLAGSLGVAIPYRLFSDVLDSSLERIPSVWRAVHALRGAGGVQVIALSNMSLEVWRTLQERYEIGSLFKAAVLSCEVGVLKPDPRIYRAALERSGAAVSDCVFVDDTLENVEAAKGLGIRSYHARSRAETARFVRRVGLTERRSGQGGPPATGTG